LKNIALTGRLLVDRAAQKFGRSGEWERGRVGEGENWENIASSFFTFSFFLLPSSLFLLL
jgi:hypothetical protein